MTTIARYRLRRLALTPGQELPSRLSNVKELPVILIEAETAKGIIGIADTLLIEGVTPETPEQGWVIACKLAELTIGMTLADADKLIAASHTVAPGATSALRLAIENAVSRDDLIGHGSIDLVKEIDPFDSHWEATFGKALEFRLTLSGELDVDLAMIEKFQNKIGPECLLRLEGDQLFNTEDAICLAEGLNPAGIEWLNQPCVAGDWEAAAAVKAAATVATKVSGFLFTPQDLETAVAMKAADFVGLSLGQSGGREALNEMCCRCISLGLKPVLGGLEQSDVTTYFEATSALMMESTATDFIGSSLAFEPLLTAGVIAENDGKLILQGPPALCEETLSLCTNQELVFPD
jgi:hypothetical protein